jgi:hypothetical protein
MSSANNSNNNNLTRMNELLSKIGRNSKPLKNKLRLKTSKSTEFLDILERKLEMLMDLKITNIEKKMIELKKISEKIIIFSDKIKNKNDRNLKDRFDNIYNINFYFIFPYLSYQILNIIINPTLTLHELKQFKKIQKELLLLFIKYHNVENNNRNYRNNRNFENMLEILDMISFRIEIHPSKNNKNQRLVEEFSQLQMQPRKNNKLKNSLI